MNSRTPKSNKEKAVKIRVVDNGELKGSSDFEMRRNFWGGGAPWQSGGGLVYLVGFLLALATERRYCHGRIFSVPKRSKTGTTLLTIRSFFTSCWQWQLKIFVLLIFLSLSFDFCWWNTLCPWSLRWQIDHTKCKTKIIFSVLSVLFSLWLGAYIIRIHTLNFNVSCPLCLNITCKSPFRLVVCK